MAWRRVFIMCHDDVIKWKHFPRYWPFVRGIHRSTAISPHKGQWHGALMFSLICAWTNGWVNNRDAGDLRRHRAHFDVIVMRYYDWGNSTRYYQEHLLKRTFTINTPAHYWNCGANSGVVSRYNITHIRLNCLLLKVLLYLIHVQVSMRN